MTPPCDGEIAAAAQLIEFMGGTIEAAALSTSASFFLQHVDLLRNSVTSLQTVVSGMPGTLLISARLVLYVFTGLGCLLGTSGMLLRARGGEDVAWRSSTSSLPELRQSSSTSCTSSSSVSSSDKAVVAGEPWDSQTLFPYLSSKTSQKTISFRFVRNIVSIYSYSR